MTTKIHSGTADSPRAQAQPNPAAAQSKLIIGWREWVTFPDFGGVRVKAKIDTGARTSALHASDITPFEKDGQRMVAFDIHPRPGSIEPAVSCVAPLIAYRRIRNSGGQDTFRYIIKTSIDIGNQIWPIEISLTRRDRLQLRMLLGRTALGNRYLIDPVKSYLYGR